MKRPPDFIIIGAMKCATSTLHEQLARQPGIFMSNPKEPNFFSDETSWEKGSAWYESLFAAAPPGTICGESSTHYTKWPTYPQTVSRMKQYVSPQTKFIYIMRQPIDRLVSQYIHEWTQRVTSLPIDQAIVEHPELIAYSLYATQLTPYLETFGEERILPVFFEHLSRRPQTELERVCEFIGYQRLPQWDDAIAEQNASAERMRVSPVRDAIVNLPGVKQIRRAVVPKRAREWIKAYWRMKQRPVISVEPMKQLTEVFDGDLARLGRWFGLQLDCANFKEIAAESTPGWRAPHEVKVA